MGATLSGVPRWTSPPCLHVGKEASEDSAITFTWLQPYRRLLDRLGAVEFDAARVPPEVVRGLDAYG